MKFLQSFILFSAVLLGVVSCDDSMSPIGESAAPMDHQAASPMGLDPRDGSPIGMAPQAALPMEVNPQAASPMGMDALGADDLGKPEVAPASPDEAPSALADIMPNPEGALSPAAPEAEPSKRPTALLYYSPVLLIPASSFAPAAQRPHDRPSVSQHHAQKTGAKRRPVYRKTFFGGSGWSPRPGYGYGWGSGYGVDPYYGYEPFDNMDSFYAYGPPSYPEPEYPEPYPFEPYTQPGYGYPYRP